MKEHKKWGDFAQFSKFLMTDEQRFRKSVLYSPLMTAFGSFILYWLILGRSLSESLFSSAFIFLLICFIGMVYEIFKRRGLR